MKREAGFSLVEVLVAAAVTLIIMGVTLRALTDAVYATQGVTVMADTQENLRAGMNSIVRDFAQAGAGIPEGGITIPNTAGVSALNRPGPSATGQFPTSWTTLPAISSGFQGGPITTVSGVGTDTVTFLYGDTSLLDAGGHWLNEFPIYLAPTGVAGCAPSNPTPAPAGSIVTAGTTTTVTFDSTCVAVGGTSGIQPGDLIMLQNNNTTSGDPTVTGSNASVSSSGGNKALLYVSSVSAAANTITFSTGDPFNLNNSGKTSGTIAAVGPGGVYPTTAATRIWMITYYINNAVPLHPRLMRQVNMRAPQAVAEDVENVQILYDILNAGSIPPSVTAAVGSPTTAQLPYIRDAYVTLFARSHDTFTQSNTYFRNNLTTVVSIRGLNFYNQFN